MKDASGVSGWPSQHPVRSTVRSTSAGAEPLHVARSPLATAPASDRGEQAAGTGGSRSSSGRSRNRLLPICVQVYVNAFTAVESVTAALSAGEPVPRDVGTRPEAAAARATCLMPLAAARCRPR